MTYGEIFIGKQNNGKINRNGNIYYSNGDKYVVNYVNNIRNGNGHYINENFGYLYRNVNIRKDMWEILKIVKKMGKGIYLIVGEI